MTAARRRVDLAFVSAALLTLLGIAILIGLGTWQVQRLGWKQDLIAHAQERSQAALVPLPSTAEWNRLDPADYEYRAVRLSGTFRHDEEVHVYTALSEPRGAFGGPGWWVLTPLELEGGGTVFINRGFVPEAQKDPETRAQGQVQGTVEIEGLMRQPETGNPFVPDPNPETNVWFTRNPAEIATYRDLPPPIAPFYIDSLQTPPSGLPQGGETRLTFRNQHLGYALTWYGLAVALAGVFAVWAHGRLAGKDHDE